MTRHSLKVRTLSTSHTNWEGWTMALLSYKVRFFVIHRRSSFQSWFSSIKFSCTHGPPIHQRNYQERGLSKYQVSRANKNFDNWARLQISCTPRRPQSLRKKGTFISTKMESEEPAQQGQKRPTQ